MFEDIQKIEALKLFLISQDIQHEMSLDFQRSQVNPTVVVPEIFRTFRGSEKPQ
jgi:hypothetical protein